MGIGHRIRDLRKNAGLTLEQLSELSGVEPGTIFAIEKRDSSRSQFIGQLARALGTTHEALTAPRFSAPVGLVAREPDPPPHHVRRLPQPSDDKLTSELLTLWARLDNHGKRKCLEVVRPFVEALAPHAHGHDPRVAEGGRAS